MAAHNSLTVLESTLLRALQNGPVVGLRALAERAEGRALASSSDLPALARYTAAMRELMNRGLIAKTATTRTIRLSLTRAGRRAMNATTPFFSGFSRLALSLASATALVAVAGCAVPESIQLRKSLMGFPTITGLAQVRDAQTGAAYFVPCDPCAGPSVKTPVAVIAEERLQPVARIAPVPQRQDLIATLAVPVVPVAVAAAPPPARIEPKAVAAASPEVAAPRVFLFGNSASALDAGALASLKAYAKKTGTTTTFEVRGQTDNTGTAAGNKRLALARAQAVRSALISAGVAADKIKASSCIDCFVASNDTEEGRHQNRRAELSQSKSATAK